LADAERRREAGYCRERNGRVLPRDEGRRGDGTVEVLPREERRGEERRGEEESLIRYNEA